MAGDGSPRSHEGDGAMALSFSTKQVAEGAGLTTNQLHHWAKTGLLVPGDTPSEGPGTKRRYTLDDYILATLLATLKDHGWTTQKLPQASQRLKYLLASRPALRYDFFDTAATRITVFSANDASAVSIGRAMEPHTTKPCIELFIADIRATILRRHQIIEQLALF
jgi:DNA-binding transcriptional MerR regulator